MPAARPWQPPAPTSWLGGDTGTCSHVPCRPLPPPRLLRRWLRARHGQTQGRGDTGQAAQESDGADMEEPGLSREAPGESKRREEPE